MYKGLLIPIVISCVSGVAIAGESGHAETGMTVARIAQGWLERGRVQGLTVAVSQDEEIVFEAGFGWADKVAASPQTPDAELDYFSIGKHMTAAILLRLAERGAVDLDAPAGDYLDGAEFHGASVTIRQLLQHTSGLWEAEMDETAPSPRFLRPPAPGDVLAWANDSRRYAAPGETWMYSNAGYLFAGLIAERVTGKSFVDLVEDELRSPLSLERFGHCAQLPAERLRGFYREESGIKTAPPIDPRWFGGSGSVCGSIGDLIRWWLALRRGEVIGAAALAQMFEPAELTRAGQTTRFGYGLGIRMGSYRGEPKIGHTGSGGGGTGVLAEYPRRGLVIAVFTNTSGRDTAFALDIEADIAATLLELKPETEGAPLAAAAGDALPGLYRTPTVRFCVERRNGRLTRTVDGGTPVPLHHLGNARFRADDDDAGIEYFPQAGPAPAQWFAYAWHGFPEDVAVRAGASCD